jgi:hypothetical protein
MCEKCVKLERDLAFANKVIFDLQNIIRDLRHDIVGLSSPLCAQARERLAKGGA